MENAFKQIFCTLFANKWKVAYKLKTPLKYGLFGYVRKNKKNNILHYDD